MRRGNRSLGQWISLGLGSRAVRDALSLRGDDMTVKVRLLPRKRGLGGDIPVRGADRVRTVRGSRERTCGGLRCPRDEAGRTGTPAARRDPASARAAFARTGSRLVSRQCALVRLAQSSFRDPAAHGNERSGSWIEGPWSPVRDLDESASRGANGRACRRSRGGGTPSTTWWSARGSSYDSATGKARRGSRRRSDAAIASCASGEPVGRPPLASRPCLTRRGAAGHLA